MKRFGFETVRKSIQAEKQALLELAFLIAGICGILLVVRSLPYVSFSESVVFAGIILICVVMYGVFTVRRKWLLKGCAAILAVCGISAAVRWDLFAAQTSVVLECLSGTQAQREADVTFAILLIAAVLSVCFFALEIVWRQHWLPYILVTVLMAGSPLFGIQTGIAPIVLGLAFQILFWTMRTAESQDQRTSKTKIPKTKIPLAVRCSGFMSAVLCVLICISVIITSVWGSELSGFVYSGEGFVSRIMQRIIGMERDPVANGEVSSGNNYRTGDFRMTVTLYEQPEDTLYLKGFTGGEYTGGEWAPVDESEIFHMMAQETNWEGWEDWIGVMYSILYFTMNYAVAEEEPRQMIVRYEEDSYQTIYTPYFNGWLNQRDSLAPGYAYQYYEESEMAINWEDVPDDFEMRRDWYRQIYDAYVKEGPKNYTGVPEDLVPRLAELCRNENIGSLEEATAFILATLQSSASYTLTPGRAPVNEDIVEYFLFENHEGYCVHFASAATLMYRLFGFPARYASGYALQPSDFVQQEDGTWRAQVTDASAHAWTEIFLEDYGWIPVEVTPASDGSYSTSYPGLDTADLEELISAIELNRNTSDGEENDPDSAATDPEKGDSAGAWGFSFHIDLDRYHSLILIIATVLAVCLFLPIFLYYRKLRRRKKIEHMNCREIFDKYLKMLHKAGHMSGYSGTERDFTEKLSKALPCVSREEAEQMVEIVSRAAYGRKEVSEEENEFVRRIWFRTEEWLRRRSEKSKHRK